MGRTGNEMETFFFNLTLAQAATATGAIVLLIGIALIAAPTACRPLFRDLGRNKIAGWILAALALAWGAWLVKNTPMERFEGLKAYIYIAAPVVYFLIVKYLDDLLATRALGALLLLLANPIVLAARWHDSEWRLVMTVIAYLWVVAGIPLVLSPFLWRRWMLALLKTDARCRALGALNSIVGACLLLLAWRVY